MFRVRYAEEHLYEKLITARTVTAAEVKGQRQIDKLTAADSMESGGWREVNIPQNVSIFAEEYIKRNPQMQTQPNRVKK